MSAVSISRNVQLHCSFVHDCAFRPHVTSAPSMPFNATNLVVLLGGVGNVIRRAVLTLEADGLVGREVADHGVASSEHGKPYDDTYGTMLALPLFSKRE